MEQISIATFQRIIKKAGAERVSDDAAIELRDIIENLADELAIEIIKVARHAGRKTIKSEDIDLITK
jgi:DNA-binding protein